MRHGSCSRQKCQAFHVWLERRGVRPADCSVQLSHNKVPGFAPDLCLGGLKVSSVSPADGWLMLCPSCPACFVGCAISSDWSSYKSGRRTWRPQTIQKLSQSSDSIDTKRLRYTRGKNNPTSVVWPFGFFSSSHISRRRRAQANFGTAAPSAANTGAQAPMERHFCRRCAAVVDSVRSGAAEERLLPVAIVRVATIGGSLASFVPSTLQPLGMWPGTSRQWLPPGAASAVSIRREGLRTPRHWKCTEWQLIRLDKWSTCAVMCSLFSSRIVLNDCV